jgi:hypothetical protein
VSREVERVTAILAGTTRQGWLSTSLRLYLIKRLHEADIRSCFVCMKVQLLIVAVMLDQSI